MKNWRIRFRVISPDDYMMPSAYIPTEETVIEAETADEAWAALVTGEYALPMRWYRREEIREVA